MMMCKKRDLGEDIDMSRLFETERFYSLLKRRLENTTDRAHVNPGSLS